MDTNSKLKRQQTHSLPLVSTTGDTLEVQANALAQHFERVSSSSHHTKTLDATQTICEKFLRNHSKSNSSYNYEFSLRALGASRSSCKPSAPGQDNIPYTMIENLRKETLEKRLYE